MKLRTLAMLIAVVVLLPLAAFAQTDVTGTMSVSANVTQTCSVASGSMAFGTYDPTAFGDLDVMGNIWLTCTNLGPATIKLNEGQHGLGTLGNPDRHMHNPTNAGPDLQYSLFSDIGRNLVWEGVTGIGFTGSGDEDSVAVYGRIPQLQNVAPGNFSDTVTITVTY
jgi:spore coat protein U domain-containing protein, fimbrial subunit CupE1/2/3/6